MSRAGRREVRAVVALGCVVVLALPVAGCGAHPSSVARSPRKKTAAVASPRNNTPGSTPPTGVVVLPDVVGDTYGSAQVRLATMGALGVQVAYRLAHNAEVLAGLVVAQSPRPGEVVSSDQTVTLTVSDGPARVAGAPPCTADDLRAGTGGPPVAEATGQNTLDITLRNVSRSTCMLDGHPTVLLLDPHGRTLRFRYAHRGDQMTTGAGPSPVYLPPEATAWVRLNKYRCDIASTDHATSVVLGLPRGGGSIVLPGTADAVSLTYCAEAPSLRVAVSPFEPVVMLLWP